MWQERVEMYKYKILNNRISVIHTINIGSIMRLAVMSYYGKHNSNGVSRILSGKNQNGLPLSGHMHAFYVPTDDDRDGYIDHIVVMTSSNLTQEEKNAVTSVKKMYSGRHQIDMNLQLCDSTDVILTMTSDKWISITPFVLNRHTKKKGGILHDTPKEQLEKEIKRRNSSLTIKNITVQNNQIMKISGLRPDQFRRTRKDGESIMAAYEATIEFRIPVQGPLLLGYGCHFGLGVFVPYEEDQDDKI